MHPYRIIAAGRSVYRPADTAVTKRYDQHFFILTFSGCGRVVQDGRAFDMPPGTVAWLDTSRDHAHGCHAESEGWHYLWFAVVGYGLEPLFERLGEAANPLTADDPAMRQLFEDAVANLARQDRTIDAVSTVIAARAIGFFCAAPSAGSSRVRETNAIRHAMQAFRSEPDASWSVARFAALCNMSPAHFHRRFKQANGASPMQWVRVERINAAKYLLSATADPISTVGRRCGYPDPYHFSREFTRTTGVTPTRFRRTGGV